MCHCSCNCPDYPDSIYWKVIILLSTIRDNKETLYLHRISFIFFYLLLTTFCFLIKRIHLDINVHYSSDYYLMRKPTSGLHTCLSAAPGQPTKVSSRGIHPALAHSCTNWLRVFSSPWQAGRQDSESVGQRK